MSDDQNSNGSGENERQAEYVKRAREEERRKADGSWHKMTMRLRALLASLWRSRRTLFEKE